MPRAERLDIPGLLQHVMVRGIENRKDGQGDVAPLIPITDLGRNFLGGRCLIVAYYVIFVASVAAGS